MINQSVLIYCSSLKTEKKPVLWWFPNLEQAEAEVVVVKETADSCDRSSSCQPPLADCPCVCTCVCVWYYVVMEVDYGSYKLGIMISDEPISISHCHVG